MNSGRKINYSLRPSKSIERKMICEFLQKANKMHTMKDYRYIGFGSFYFADFVLFHNALGITNMISIENSENEERYSFNKPYKCIDMIFNDSTVALSNSIEWEGQKDIIWLDYDKSIKANMISDFEFCIKKASAGSIIIISFATEIENEKKERMPWLEKEVKDYLRPGLKEKDISSKNLFKVLWQVVRNSADKAIVEKNSGVPSGEENKFTARPVMFFQYNDNTPMITIAYLICGKEEKRKFSKCEFKELPWYKQKEECYTITTPNLTWHEVRTINKLLPTSDIDTIKTEIKFIAEKDLMNYIKVYKYYPNYLEGNLV